MDDNRLVRLWWRFRDRLPHTGFMRSGLVTALLLAAVAGAFGLVWRAHQRAQFHQLTTKVLPPTPSVPMPGGQEAITLSRLALLNNTAPEFVSTTLLPGIGMQVLQITVSIPNRGTRNLLLAPTVTEAAGTEAGKVNAGPFHLHVSTHRESRAKLLTEAELIGASPAHQATNLTTADGGEAGGSFSSADTDATTNLGVQADVSSVLTGRALDLTVRVKNSSSESRFAVLEWEPQFLLPENGSRHLALAIPSTTRVQQHAAGNSLQNGAEDFSAPTGRALEDRAIDGTYGALKREFLADGPIVRLIYLDDGVTLRMSALGPLIRSIHLRTNLNSHSLLLGFSSSDPAAANGDDPETVLRPGQTALWHLRIEIVSTNAGNDRVFSPVR